MTGFGRAARECEWGTAVLELSSVNHRYQDITVRLPREMYSLEPWFHQKLRGVFRRGKVQLRAEVTWAASTLAVSINREVLMKYYQELYMIRNALGSNQDILLEPLLALPGVQDSSGSAESGWKDRLEILESLLGDAVTDWNRMRMTEGAHLREAIGAHLDELERSVKEIADVWPGERESAFEAMKERIAGAVKASGTSIDESRMITEAVIIADRWDIAEELSRLSSHIDKFRGIGLAPEPEGRKLDFIAQEMNREANTINSKVSSSRIRWITVEAKTAIERIREQVQNLE
jgi:uncharacterized protein (TIGR00255 family)